MNLYEGLKQIAEYLDLSLDALVAYAAQDNIGGWDGDHEKYHWPTGSIWSVEGQTLYALVCAKYITQAAELGTWAGCSASHMAQAMIDQNLNGSLTCVDPDQNAGYLILADRAQPITFKNMDRFDYLASIDDNSLDLLFDDTPKNINTCAQVAREAQRVLRPGGLYITHDADHFLTGEAIQGGLRLGGISDHLTVRMEPSDCGLAIWRKPGKAEPQPPRLEDLPVMADDEPTYDRERLNKKLAPFVDIPPVWTMPKVQESDEDEPPPPPASSAPYDSWTVAELQAELDDRGIDYKSRDRKDELIARLVSDDES